MLKIEIKFKPHKGKKIKLKNSKRLLDELLEKATKHIENDADIEIQIKNTKR